MKNANLIVSIKKIIWIFVFHRQTSRVHKSLKSWTFWACKTSFEKLTSRAFRCQKVLVGFWLRKSKKNRPEDRPFIAKMQIFWRNFTIRKSGFRHTSPPNRFYRGTKGYLVGKHADFWALLSATERENQIFVSRNLNFPL